MQTPQNYRIGLLMKKDCLTIIDSNLDPMLKKYKGKSQLCHGIFSPLKHKYSKEACHGEE